MKLFVTVKIILAVAALFVCGCTSLERALDTIPLISARELHIEKNSPYVTVRIDATNLVIGETQVVADEIVVSTGTPFTGSTSLRAVGYQREKRQLPPARPAR